MIITNIPKKIYLQVGETDDDANDFEILKNDVTWCADKIYKNDIEYRLKEKNPATRNKTAKGIITLCGSTGFYETFLEINNKLTAKGYIVLSIGVVKSKAVMLDKSADPELEKMLDALHREKCFIKPCTTA